MKTLAISDKRPEKLLEPLQTTDDQVTVDLSGYPLWRKMYHLTREINKNKDCDIFLVHSAGVLGLITTIFSVLFGSTMVVRLGGDSWATNTKKIKDHWQNRNYILSVGYYGLRYINELVYIFCDGFIVVSEPLKEKVVEETGISPDCVQIVHPPVKLPPTTNNLTTELEVFKEKKVVLTVTNLRFRGKFEGVKTALTLLELVMQQREDVVYVIAGNGLFLNHLQTYISENLPNSIQNRIHTLGFINNIYELYGISDVFVYISYEDAYPNVVLEAQMSSLPIVANNYTGYSEQLTDGETGVIVDPTQPDASAEVIMNLLDSPMYCRQLGNRARKTVEVRNSVSSVGDDLRRKLEKVYLD